MVWSNRKDEFYDQAGVAEAAEAVREEVQPEGLLEDRQVDQLVVEEQVEERLAELQEIQYHGLF